MIRLFMRAMRSIYFALFFAALVLSLAISTILERFLYISIG